MTQVQTLLHPVLAEFTAADTVRGLLSFTINTPQSSTPSLAVQEYIEDGANRYAYKYTGVRINSLGIEFPMANIIKATFNAAGAGFSVLHLPILANSA